MAANISFFDTSNTIIDIFNGVNQNTNNAFGLVIIGILALILYISFIHYGFKRVLVLEGFVLTIVTVLLTAAGWIAFIYVMLPALLLFAGILLVLFAKD